MSSTSADQTYATELAQARIAALRALIDLLQATDDPVEKRRIATAILKLPKPDLHSNEAAQPTANAPTCDDEATAPEPAQAAEPSPLADMPVNHPAEIPFLPAPTTRAARIRSICGTDQPTGPPDNQAPCSIVPPVRRASRQPASALCTCVHSRLAKRMEDHP